MARRARERWTLGDVIAGAIGILGGGAGLVWFAGWMTADLGRALVVLAVAGGALCLWFAISLVGLLRALLAR